MSFHDRLVQKAVRDGNSSLDFKIAAQKHANASWLYGIIAAIVFYFFGWGWALLPAGLCIWAIASSVSATIVQHELDALERDHISLEARIIKAYGQILETSAPVIGMISDTSQLPFSKAAIKEALISQIRSSKDEEYRQNLRSAYVLLADWQEGVGDTPVGIDQSDIDPSLDPVESARRMVEGLSNFQKWNALAESERSRLMKEMDLLDGLE